MFSRFSGSKARDEGEQMNIRRARAERERTSEPVIKQASEIQNHRIVKTKTLQKAACVDAKTTSHHHRRHH